MVQTHDLAHPAGAKERENRVRAEARTGREGHGISGDYTAGISPTSPGRLQ